MRSLVRIFCFFIIFLCTIISSYGQEVRFLNTPALFTENNVRYQQISVMYHAETNGTINISKSGRTLLNERYKEGDNYYLLTVPSTKKKQKQNFTVKTDNNQPKSYSFTLEPVTKRVVYLVQHSHTDIGYTRPQSEILAEHLRYIDYALDYCDQTDNLPDDAKFRWTCESAWITREYLRTRPQSQIERFLKRIKEGRIEVTGMFANMAEISDENIMYDFLQPLQEITRQGISVETTMQNDVNGVAWCMPDYLKNTGVKYLMMGINETRSIRPFDKPTAFWWESPSGARLLAFRADHYMTGNFFDIQGAPSETESQTLGHYDGFGNLIKSSSIFNPQKMLGYYAEILSKGYSFDAIEAQFSGYRTDNAPPSTAACENVKRWNEKYESPKLRLAVAGEFMRYVEKKYSNKLPVYRTAWLDWWSDGYGSTSRETAEVRKTQNMKQSSEGIYAMVTMMNGESSPNYQLNNQHISENAIFFDEHTCGADGSINYPYSENSTKQWLQKGAYSWEALKRVTLFKEEAMARLQPFFGKAEFPVIYVVNSMGWTRSGNMEIFVDNQILPRDNKVKITDMTSGEEVPFQLIKTRSEGAYWMMEVKDVPALGYKVLKIEVLPDAAEEVKTISDEAVLENNFYKIAINKSTGAISSLFDKELNRELADGKNSYNIGQLVHETSAKRDVAPFNHTTVSNVKVEKGVSGAVWESVKITSDMDGLEKGETGKPQGLDLEIRLYKNVKKVEFKYTAHKVINTDPEGLYVAFPFSLPDSRIVFETIGGILSQGEQLPGSSSDWNVAQNFVSVRGKTGQIILVSNEVPLWHFSDFNMGKFERYPKPGNTWLYSWVMNNYWFTNFRAYQEGAFSWSYQLTSTADTTNTYATKYAWGQRNEFFARSYTGGQNALKDYSKENLKVNGSPNAILINARPAETENTVLLHFREVDGKPADITLSSDSRPIKQTREVNAIGQQTGQPLTSVHLEPFEVKFIEIKY